MVLSRDAATPAALATALTETGRGASGIHRAGEPRWPRRTGAHPPGRRLGGRTADVDDLNTIAVRYPPDSHEAHTLADDAFRHDGQITKQTIRAVTLAALAPRDGELLWDVGSGSGSIAVNGAEPPADAARWHSSPTRNAAPTSPPTPGTSESISGALRGSR